MEKTYYSTWWLPSDISAHGSTIDTLINSIHYFMILLFTGWLIYFLYCLIRFSEKGNPKADLSVKHFKLPKYVEIGVVLVEACLLIFVSQPLWAKVKDQFPPESEAVVVRVVAEQFAWNVHYPGKDGKFGRTSPDLMNYENPVGVDREDPAGRDDIVTINNLHVPVNKPVIVHLSSKDVIHSFFLPLARVKQDAIPGMEIPIWFEVKETGQFEIACAQLCGNSHYRMRGSFIVDSEESFQAFLQEEHETLMEDLGPLEDEEAADSDDSANDEE